MHCLLYTWLQKGNKQIFKLHNLSVPFNQWSELQRSAILFLYDCINVTRYSLPNNFIKSWNAAECKGACVSFLVFSKLPEIKSTSKGEKFGAFQVHYNGHDTLRPVTSCEHVKVKRTWDVCTAMEACLGPTLTVNSKKNVPKFLLREDLL